MSSSLDAVAPAFVSVAHRIVWATIATTDGRDRPRTRILHPIWEWKDERLVGWIATDPSSPKRSDLDRVPYASCTYWDSQHDVATADCRATWCFDASTRACVWDLFLHAPAPLGYDPSIIPRWDGPESEAFAVLQLDPLRLRVMPGSLMMQGTGELLTWRA